MASLAARAWDLWMCITLDGCGWMASVSQADVTTTDGSRHAAMDMRARASDMHRAAERRMLACRLSTLVCCIQYVVFTSGSIGQCSPGIPTITVRKYTTRAVA